MKINLSVNNKFLGLQTTSVKNKELFKSTLLEKQEKEESSKGKLVTTREGGYVRQYIVSPKGDKILLSEVKAHDEVESSRTENYQRPIPKNNLDGLSENTNEILNLLHLETGAGLPLQMNQLSNSKSSKQSEEV
ncbi:hypothetical protein [Bacillus horti]|uniref:Uncharacterized protein n=1 Tax=Caldalkalibacillus horti TaxID=77523 RepID=A0ABT9VX88_9BACI|nr:hypothetical protein [Bacillus horti]MDQ0165601.1 hypothetical protein [Bacillus horti]